MFDQKTDGYIEQNKEKTWPVLELKNTKKTFKRLPKSVIFSVGAVLILVLAFLGWQYFLKKPSITGKFELTASLEDSAGIDPGTSFVLKSSEDLSVKTIKEILVFDPEIDFEAEKTDNKFLGSRLLKEAFAQEKNNNPSSFKIKPKEPLKTDSIYRVIIKEEAVDREYSWAYQVKAPFQVIGTHPREKGTSVPVNSGIEIIFNREGFINPEKYFSIEPEVKGSFEINNNTIIFLPNKLESAAIYTVTVKRGLGVKKSDDTLKEDYIFQFETGLESYGGQRPYFDFENDFLEFIPNHKPAFKFYSDGLDVKKLEFNVYKLPGAEEFLSSYQKSRKWSLGWGYYYRRYSGSLYQPKPETKIISFNPALIKAGYEEFIEIPQVLENGYYLIDVKFKDPLYGEKHRQAWLQITPLANYFSITDNQGLLWIDDFEKKIPIEGIEASYIEGVDKINLGKTDGEGLIRFIAPEKLKNQNNSEITEPQFFQIEHNQYQTKIIKIADGWGYYRRVNEGDIYWDYLSTDRYTYKMNDTLKYWGVLKGRTQNLRQKKLTVGIYKGWWWSGDGANSQKKALVMEETVISSFDTFKGQLQFQGLTPGFYSLQAILDGKVVTESSIQILTYAKPAYQITVTPSKNVIFTGEKVDFNVQASFFDGTPASGLRLKYGAYWQNSIDGELTLDEFGQGSFSYAPYYYGTGYDYWPRSFDVDFSPKMSEEGEISGSGRVLVFGPDIYLQASQEKKAKDTYEFKAKLNQIVLDGLEDSSQDYRPEYIGDPVGNYPVSAQIIKITHYKVETGQYYDYINKTVQKTYEYRESQKIIESFSGITDNNGEFSFIRALPEEKDSFYKVEFSVRDSKGRETIDSVYVWYSYYGSWKDFRVSLNINDSSYQEEFSKGEKINLSLQIVEGEKPTDLKTLFYRYQNNIDKAEIIPSLTYEETFEESFVPSVQYRAVILGPYGFEESNSVTASFKEEDNKLTIDIEQDKEKYRPGEKINLNLKVKDKDNKGVASEVNLAAVDEAVFHVLPYEYYSKDILRNLYENIWVSPLTYASEYAFLNESTGAEQGGCFVEETKILMSDGSLKNIEDIQVGDQVLTWTDDQEKKMVSAVVQGVSKYWVKEHLIINGSFGVTAEHRLYVNGKWLYAGYVKEGDELTDYDGKVIKVKSIKKKEGLVPVYNIIVSKYHTYFADGFYAHNEEKGGGDSRINFVDTAFYDTVETNRQGESSVSFISPDNITSWRVTAQAFAPENLKAGQNIKLIKTSLPFFVDATLNEFYLAGDSPILRLRAFGTDLKQGENVKFKAESEFLNIKQEKTSRENIAYIPLNNLSEGEHEIVISAQQGEYKDNIVKKIKVVKSYFRKSESSFYKLSDNLSGIEGNKDGFTRVKFMDLGRGRLYRALWRNRYGSGIRVDQVVSEYLANKFLSQYFEEPIEEGFLDLAQYHLENGGLGLFPYGDDDLSLSAKLADLVPEFVFKEKLKNYFYSSLADKKSDIHRISQALYGLASLNELVLAKINSIKDSQELNLEDKIHLALGLAKLGDKEGARKIYYNEIRNNLRFQGQEGWLHKENDISKRVKLTGLIAVLTSYLNDEDTRALGEYMFAHSPQNDLDALEEFLYIKSELSRLKESETEFKYQTNNRSDSVALKKGRSYELTLPFSELQSIKFSEIKGDIALVSFYERFRNPEELVKNPELSLTRTYLVDGRPVNSLKEGDVVLVRLDPKIKESAIDGRYQVIDYLPGGLKPITQIYEQGLTGGTVCDPVWYPSIIENNTVYFNIWKDFNKTPSCAKRTINYYARVVSKGAYSGNPAIIQSLKDLESLNISSASRLEIK